jgi:hypothetical protein
MKTGSGCQGQYAQTPPRCGRSRPMRQGRIVILHCHDFIGFAECGGCWQEKNRSALNPAHMGARGLTWMQSHAGGRKKARPPSRQRPGFINNGDVTICSLFQNRFRPG